MRTATATCLVQKCLLCMVRTSAPTGSRRYRHAAPASVSDGSRRRCGTSRAAERSKGDAGETRGAPETGGGIPVTRRNRLRPTHHEVPDASGFLGRGGHLVRETSRIPIPDHHGSRKNYKSQDSKHDSPSKTAPFDR